MSRAALPDPTRRGVRRHGFPGFHRPGLHGSRPRRVSVGLLLAPFLCVATAVDRLGLPAASAAEGTASETSGEASSDSSPAPVFFLRDGSRVAGRPRLDALRVDTRYGELVVPLDELVLVRLAQRVDASLRERADARIREMGSDDFDEREEAMESLRRLGVDILPILRQATGSSNEEIKNRAEILIEELEEKAQEEKTATGPGMTEVKGEQDVVTTARFTIRGRVLEEAFQIGSRYGDLRVSASDLVGIQFQRAALVARTVSVAGNRIVPSNWLNTKVQLSKGQGLRIRASGTVTVSNYGLTAGPGGTTRYSTSYNWQGIRPLALAAKVGKKGKPFLVGPEFKGKAPRDGVLYLGVVPFRTYTPAGTFKVKVDGTQ